jgi:hypothetical protein
MTTLTSIRTLAALAALGGAILVSATPADARGGGRGFAGHASFRGSVAHASFARAKVAPPSVIAAKLAGQPPAVIAAQIANPGHINTGSTSMIRNTPNGPVFDPHPNRRCIVKCSSTTATANLPGRPQFAGRSGAATSATTLSPGPGAATQPAPVAPVATQPAATTPVQPSCLRQAVTQDGRVVIFDICHNQAVVGPLAQTQTQPQTQTP